MMRTQSTRIAALTAGVLAAAWAGSAAPLGAVAPTVRAVHNSTLNRTIAVSVTGRSLYHRIGERTGHVLCGSVCSHVWPPLTVPSASTPLVRGAGVTGTLGKFRRPDGRWQVSLRGLPLYRFSGDRGAGQVHGQGVGRIWFAVSAGTASSGPPPSSVPGY
jgi:predicted lipoprotein with Yx(FWY)xxD motif